MNAHQSQANHMTTHWSLGRLQNRMPTPPNYVQSIGVVGIVLATWSLYQARLFEERAQFLGLLVLAVLAALATARQAMNGFAVTYEVGSIIGIAALPFFHVAGAILIVAVAQVSHIGYLYHRGAADESYRLKMCVNIGMHGIGIVIIYFIWMWVNPVTPVGIVFVWALIALVYDQINFWLLTSVLRFMQGDTFDVRAFWLESRWAMVMSYAVTAIGGGVLAYAIGAYEGIGILIFFLPTLLSLFAFHVITRHYQKMMGELESIVAERTAELQVANAELEETNGQLSLLNEDLTRANEANGRFLAVLSHDMRSPLTGIKLYGQMLQRRPNMDAAKRTHMMQVILQNTQTLVELVDNLVETEQSSNDKLALQFERVDLNSLLHEVAFNFEAHAVEKQIAIEVELAPEPLVISADRQLIKRSITNLVSNAIKYTANEGKVVVSVRQEDDEANIRVADTGIGIPPKEIDRIFDSYHRVDEHRATAQGLGLGLSIVKRYIELHEGEIFVTSIVGEGSQFNVYLPMPASKHSVVEQPEKFTEA